MSFITSLTNIVQGTVSFMFGTWYMVVISLYIMLEVINLYQSRGLMTVTIYRKAKETYYNFVNFPWESYAEVIKRGKK